MSNPFLPKWEYIPDGEPRVFNERVYIYGSHDKPNSSKFCDYKLKVWSASIYNLNDWTCHGHSFHTRKDRDHSSSTDHTDHEIYAPDVVEKDGKYYLFTYIYDAKGCVSVSDNPEGPFKFVSEYKFPEGHSRDDGIFNDPGVLVDDDGRVYIYCGFEEPYMAELNPENMYEVIEGSYKEDVIPASEPFNFFEASSPRKVGDKYYFIFSPKEGQTLVYAISDFPYGPFKFGGTIIDNGKDYPDGNNHGSICCINNQWYIFYHRMTNNTIMSRRACVEKIEILPDGTIPEVEMTSLGFQDSLNPFEQTSAEIACVLKGGCFITERNLFERPITGIKNGAIIGYKYFDFGTDNNTRTMKIAMKIRGMGCKSKISIIIDDYDCGKVIGICDVGMNDGTYETILESLTGVHSIFLKVEHDYNGYWDWAIEPFENRLLFELDSFVFLK